MTTFANKNQQNPVRIALGISYHGHGYHGWQRQSNAITVQEKLDEALSCIADQSIKTLCAGRTDTGVHATGQVVHFDYQQRGAQRHERSWILGTNTYLPDDISVRWAKVVTNDFHARFSATARRYRYFIDNSLYKPALFNQETTWVYQPLDINRMIDAAKYLIGEHDFTSYRAAGCQADSPVRQMHFIEIKKVAKLIMVDIKANGFLHHMVRNIVGVLMAIGSGKREPIWAKDVLAAKDRKFGDITAPPNGLYFVSVDYPAQYEMPASFLGPVFMPD